MSSFNRIEEFYIIEYSCLVCKKPMKLTEIDYVKEEEIRGKSKNNKCKICKVTYKIDTYFFKCSNCSMKVC